MRAAKSAEPKSNKLEWAKAVATPLATVAVTVVGGAFFTSALKDREARESNERLYTQLLIQREQSDANIRKDMFGVVIKQFLAESPKQDWNDKVLQLELLASNFNQSLDLAPLFKDIARRLQQELGSDLARREQLATRMDRTASALNSKQVNALARRGFEAARVVGGLARWQTMKSRTLISAEVPRQKLVPSRPDAVVDPQATIKFELELIGVNLDKREIEVRLRVNMNASPEDEVDRHFWVGRYDFPMLDNTQLPDGLRAAVVVTSFNVPSDPAEREANSAAAVHLVVFPAASASFKERQDYDDVLLDMLRQREPVSTRGKEPPP